MSRIEERASQWGIETAYWDGLGRHRTVAPDVLARLLEIFAAAGAPPAPPALPLPTRPAFQPSGERFWALAVQLYGVRSRRNCGHGDFGDLEALIDLAANLGAAGISLNPLHTLFDDRPEMFSPYSPSSRLFLNSRYVDLERIPEFPGWPEIATSDELHVLRDAELVDYARVVELKDRALRRTYDAFRSTGSPSRHLDFAQFQRQRGRLLMRFSSFEFLRHRFNGPWWEWPAEWQKPDDFALARLRNSDEAEITYYAFLQWVADDQLRACRERANARDLPIGLYLDIAVGVRPDGFDAWNEQDVIIRNAEIGAPPDRLNLEGQRWGLAGINPTALIAHDFEPFRQMLEASMRYAGAIRIDHALGLKRLYMIPSEMRADQGAYLRFPFEALLEVISEESLAHRCVVIGEDLGTVPEGFRETLAKWGIWSYQVMMFERAADGGFIAVDQYRRDALVTFATHDLPTFAGWKSGHDLAVKRGVGMDPGESDGERAAALDALGRAMAWRGIQTLDFPSIVKFLADAPSRLLVISMEDALGLDEQVNVPGTVLQHPNWQRRLPKNVEDLSLDEELAALSEILSSQRQTKNAAAVAPEVAF